MKLAKMRTGLFGLTAFALAFSVMMSGLMLAPNSAGAFWWPWAEKYAHAEENGDDDHVTVTIKKYIDGERANEDSANGHSFPMTASWDDPEDGEGSGNYSLSADNEYKAVTSMMNEGADYSTSEKLDGDVVATNCETGHPYKLVGYSTGATIEAAIAGQVSTNTPAFTDLTEDMYVIVWNETCEEDDDHATSTDGTIVGEVTGGQSGGDAGELEVTSVEAEKTTAIANGEFADGWKYVFNITVPTDETKLAMKFADWMQTGGSHVLPVANNMRISSAQADNGGATILLTAADTYSSPDLNMTGDLNAGEEGLQVQVVVEVAVPSDTFNGTYSTEYGVRTLP